MLQDITQNFFVHPSSYIDNNVQIGIGTKIWHFCHIMEGATIGQDCSLGQNTFVGKDVRIGNNVKIQNNVSIYEGVEIKDDVFLGPSCIFTNILKPRSFNCQKDNYIKTIVGKGATIGAGAIIVCGNIIGEYSFIGAGSVVTRNVDPQTLVYGNPAKFKNFICRCGGIMYEFSKNITFSTDRRFRCISCAKVFAPSLFGDFSFVEIDD